MFVEVLDIGFYRGNIGFKVGDVLPEVIQCGYYVYNCIFYHHFKHYLTHRCYFQFILVHFRYNLRVCCFCGGVRDSIIRLYVVFILPGMLVNEVNDMVLDVLYGKSSIFCNEVPGFFIGFLNNHYI